MPNTCVNKLGLILDVRHEAFSILKPSAPPTKPSLYILLVAPRPHLRECLPRVIHDEVVYLLGVRHQALHTLNALQRVNKDQIQLRHDVLTATTA